jgi:hypothetical protein
MDKAYWLIFHMVDGDQQEQVVFTSKPDLVMEMAQDYANRSGFKTYAECRMLNIQREFEPKEE